MNAGKKSKDNNDLNLIVRIFSTDISGTKTCIVGLCKIKGIDSVFSHAILKTCSINPDKLVGRLSKEEIKKIEEVIKTPVKKGIPEYLINRRKTPEKNVNLHVVGSDLKLKTDFDIRRMRRIRSYKGLRHAWGLKVRGQKTKSYRKGGAAVAGIKKTTLK